MLRDIKKHFLHEEKKYYKPVRVNNFRSDNFIEYRSITDRNKRQSVEENLIKIRPYLKEKIIAHGKFY